MMVRPELFRSTIFLLALGANPWIWELVAPSANPHTALRGCGFSVSFALVIHWLASGSGTRIVTVHLLSWSVFICSLTSTLTGSDPHDRHLRLILLALCALGSVPWIFSVARYHRRGGRRTWVGRLGAGVFGLYALVLAGETFLMFIPQSSNGGGFTLGEWVWRDEHKLSFNRWGYRDRDHTTDTRKTIVVLGDSFVQGVGIPNDEDRFTGVLQESLPSDWVVHNVGVAGIDTRTALGHLDRYPVEPDILVLSFCGNDIDELAQAAGHRFVRHPYSGLPPWLIGLVEGSYLASYVYWEQPFGHGSDYLEVIRAAYNDPDVVSELESDLEDVRIWTESREIPLVVVIFPFLNALEFSRIYVGRLQNLFAKHGVPTLDVTSLVIDLPALDRTISVHDAHPSALVHERTGAALAKLLEERGLLR